MRKETYGIIIISICLAVLLWGLFSMGRLMIIRYQGDEVRAVITKVPLNCDRYNYIKVLFVGDEYEVSISRDDCRAGIYKMGQEVVLLKHKKYSELVWPGSHPEWVIVIVLVVLVYIYIVTRKYCQ